MKELIINHFSGNWLPFFENYLPGSKKLIRKGKQHVCLCPFHDDSDPSLSINAETGQFHCFGCKAEGDAFSFYAKMSDLDVNNDFAQILSNITHDFGLNGRKTRNPNIAKNSIKSAHMPFTHYELGNPTEKYPYIDENGNPVSYNCRFELPNGEKTFRQCKTDGLDWSVKGLKKVPYRLSRIIEKDTVYIVEGEKDVHTLESMGWTATCNAGGAGNWTEEHSKYLYGKSEIIILPDNDEPGKRHAKKVAESLCGHVGLVKIVELPDLSEKEDVSDFIKKFQHGDEAAERLSIIIDSAPPFSPTPGLTSPHARIVEYTAAQLINTDFPEPKWAVPGILTEGFTVLAGKPKQGKSIMALNLGISVSSGGVALGNIKVESGTVIYLALEDTPRRLKERLQKMYIGGGKPSPNLLLYPQWPRMGSGGIKSLSDKISEHTDIRFVIIDTLAKFRPPKPKGISPYEYDYDVGCQIKAIADEYGVAILVIHHLRKTVSEDRMDDISGTFGVTGSADSSLVLVRQTSRSDAELQVTGRDVESTEYALTFDARTLSWHLLGKVDEVKNTKQQQKLYDAIKDCACSVSPKELEKITGLQGIYIRKTLAKFVESGTVKKEGHGQYIYISLECNGV